jgi:hypothetical protein
MSRKKGSAAFLLGIASALGLAWLIRRRSGGVSGLSAWRRTLARHYGVGKAQELAAAVQERYAVLAAGAVQPENRHLRWHLTEKILPGLALYRVLLNEQNGDNQAALRVVEEALTSEMLASSRMQFAPLQWLPDAFPVLKIIFPFRMKAFPAEGWDFTYLENSDERIAFNATRCFYLNTLTKYDAPELTASFCKCDDAMAEAFPPSIRFIRPHTLGRGDALCDFEYCRVRS